MNDGIEDGHVAVERTGASGYRRVKGLENAAVGQMPPCGLRGPFSIAFQIRLFSLPLWRLTFVSCITHGVMGRRSEVRRKRTQVFCPLAPSLLYPDCPMFATSPPVWLSFPTYSTGAIMASRFCGFLGASTFPVGSSNLACTPLV